MATAVNLNTPQITEFELGEDIPPDWQPAGGYSVELSFGCVGGKPVFAYRDSPIPAPAVGLAPLLDWSAGELKGFAPIEAFGDKLDLKVSQNCMVILRMAEDQNIHWSIDPPPIVTKGQPREDVYFGLRLVDRGVSYRPHEFPRDRMCKQINFCCRKLSGATQLHAFALNVLVESCTISGHIDFVHIDPDIRNPSLS